MELPPASTGDPPTKIVVYGESLGSVVALSLLQKYRPDGLVIHNGFPSLVELGAEAYSFLPVRALLKDRFEMREAARKLPPDVPVLLMHSVRDEVVPFKFGAALRDELRGEVMFEEMVGTMHNDVPFAGERQYLAAMRRFLARV